MRIPPAIMTQITLAKDLPRDFIMKQIRDASDQCVKNETKDNVAQVFYWTHIFILNHAIKRMGYENFIKKYDEVKESIAMYSVMKG